MCLYAIRSLVAGLAFLSVGCGEGESESAAQAGGAVFPPAVHSWKAVSYTHLTLPTILLV